MATASLLTIVGDAIKEVGSMIAPSAVYTSTDTNVAKFLVLSNREGRDLTRSYNWTVLQRLATITTVASQDEYALPSDYDRLMPDTEWDRSNYQPIWGPLSPEEWQAIKSGTLGSGLVGRRYRIVRSSASAASRTVRIDPTPSVSGDTLVFEYISNAWCTDTLGTTLRSEWAADTDVSLLDRDLMTLGLIVRFKRSVGLEYASEADEYAEILARTKSQDRPSATLSLVGSPFGRVDYGSVGLIGAAAQYLAETHAVLAAFTTQPTARRGSLMDSLIRTLKSCGAWDVLDGLIVLAAADSQASLINWKSPSATVAATLGAPVFTADRGWTGTNVQNGAAANAGFLLIPIPSVHITQTSMHMGEYFLRSGLARTLQTESGIEMTAPAGVDNYASINVDPFNTGNVFWISLSDDFSGAGVANTTSLGYYVASRSGNARTGYKNGVSALSDTLAPLAITTVDDMYFCTSDFQAGVIHWGGSLTAAQVSAMYSAFGAYLSALGAV